MKKLLCLLLVAVLALGCFSGCRIQLLADPAMTEFINALRPTEPTAPSESTPTDTPTEPTETDAPETEAPAEIPQRLQNAGERDYLEDGYVEMVPFPEMAYERPDVETLEAQIEELAAMAERGDDPDAILTAYYAVSDGFLNFRTMDSLSYIRYTLNTNDSYYKDEYDWLEQVSPDLQEKLETFLKACANSPVRDALERDYFGYGYFDEYEDYEVYTNPDYLALAKQEEELLAEYRSALESPTITYGGETLDYNEALAAAEEALENSSTYTEYYESVDRYIGVLKAYYEQYNVSVGQIYLELVKVRKQMATVLGYESYADYAYEISYERDYTHEQGAAYLAQVKELLVPVYEEVGSAGSGGFSMTQDQVERALTAAVRSIGGEVQEAWDFMHAYELYDLSVAPEKFDSSFTTYLYNYEAPFLTVNAKGTSDDFTTFSHEFGHFTDNYVNYGADEDLETAETFSQAMELLALCYTEGVLSQTQIREMIRGNLSSLLENSFLFQGALAAFEDRVYALDESELTVEKVNECFRQSCIDYGAYDEDWDFYYRMMWIDVTHFFEMPYYVISYVVSADTALQVYRLESEQTGAGLDAYRRLLDRTPGDGVQAVMQTAGMENPFRSGSLTELAAFFREQLG